MIYDDYNQLGVQADVNAHFEYWLNDAINQDDYEEMIFFYHKDLPKAFGIGSSTQISDGGANIIQHIEYLPYGELFFERRDIWNTPYKFNAKELDAETGMYYYGARYYTPEVSIWLSVDPLADKYPSMSPFMYCAGNPVVFIDPNGMEIIFDGSFLEKAKMRFETIKLRIQSHTFRNMYKDLKNSDNTHTFKIGEEWGHESEGWDFENGSNTTITMNFKKIPNNSPSGTTFSILMGHEVAHAWLSDRGLGEPSTPEYNVSFTDKSFSSSKMVDAINSRNYEYSKYQETEACHIENIIRGELKLPLRDKYDSIEKISRNKSGTFSYKREVLNVIKKGYNYYKKNNIYKDYNVLPQTKKK